MSYLNAVTNESRRSHTLRHEADVRHGDMVDQATAEREAFISVQVSAARRVVAEQYGTVSPGQMIEPRECGNQYCGKQISQARLAAVPKAKYCTSCQEHLEEYKMLPRES